MRARRKKHMDMAMGENTTISFLSYLKVILLNFIHSLT